MVWIEEALDPHATITHVHGTKSKIGSALFGRSNSATIVEVASYGTIQATKLVSYLYIY